MKIIPQSFKHLPERSDLIQQIGSRARICYQSEPVGDETSFVNGIIKKGHNSCLEMGVVHIAIKTKPNRDKQSLLQSKYIVTTEVPEERLLYCTGSIRAWREFIINAFAKINDAIAYDLLTYLRNNTPAIFWNDFFNSIDREVNMKSFDPKTLNAAEYAKHQHVAMKIITNRVVTHEMVRHRPVAFLQESQRYCRYGDSVIYIKPTGITEPSQEYCDWVHVMVETEKTYSQLLKTCPPQIARNVLPNSCKTEIIVYCSLQQWEHILNMRHSKHADPSMQEIAKPIFDWFVKYYPKYFTTKEALQRSIG